MSVEELHEVGEALAWGYSALARATKIDESTVARWWTGKRSVPLPIAAKLRVLAEFHVANPFPPPPPFVKRDRDESGIG
jgi:transcriptional regulator with XRE-family HTH domain